MVFFVELLLMWAIGRVQSTTDMRYAIPQELLMVVALGSFYLIRLGLPEGWVNFSVLRPEECSTWNQYFGCGLPPHHFFLLFMTAVVVMQRCMRYNISEVRATIPHVEGAVELGGLLCKTAKDVEDCQKLLRSNIENVLPVPSHDIIRNTRALFDLIITLSCVLLPAAVISFVQGVMMASLLGVVENVVSLLDTHIYALPCMVLAQNLTLLYVVFILDLYPPTCDATSTITSSHDPCRERDAFAWLQSLVAGDHHWTGADAIFGGGAATRLQ
ncbi:hypothetical protein TraAM80_02363 [Trypanosoma rangeli]|uniref:Uncharacterized protein n=1 Tax=Trypanosoma rangeli TaxID=5698 RepID=A0A3R7MNY6_TRYRA|nr:uncharacterized protein TraAM80_02363 [Trypanosoma rangeli]RNF08956.1 hypothetical protein TraAM80_02363 [Trypanosoma rangeli]|eukprot:RNF08956.1 hypothetical protein TraAM80_02363 [Trypanosoma rangeli]